jgi:chorismate dehydratase
MDSNEPLPRLRMAQPDSPEELARRFEREKRAALLQEEDSLGISLRGFRAGSVPYLNAAPLTRGIEDQIELVPPSLLAGKLRAGELDAALVSVTEVLFNDLYDVLDGIAVASLGEVKSVFLAHRIPLGEITEIFCDTASLTSVNLLRVLLARRGLSPKLSPLPAYDQAASLDAVMLIGDEAIRFLRSGNRHEIMDLGTAWQEVTGLPFVYAVWALRRGIENTALRRALREARNFGMETLDSIIRDRPEFDYEFRKDYLGWHIHYHIGSDEKRGLARFIEMLRALGPGPVYDPRFVA